MNIIDNNTTVPSHEASFESSLEVAINENFPVLYGIPGSWADLMDFIDEYTAAYKAQYPSPCPPTPTEKDRELSFLPKTTNWATTRQARTKMRQRRPEIIAPKKRVYIRNDKPNISLIMKNLPAWGSDTEDLVPIFEQYGRVRSIRIITDGGGKCYRGIAFVEFMTMEDSARAYDALYRFSYQERTIYTEYAIERKNR